MPRTLVTGGAGFIGSHIVRRLIELNHNVLVLDDLSFGKIESLSRNADSLRFVKGDIANKSVSYSIIEDFRPEIVFHLAALHFIPFCNEHPVRTVETNVIGTRYLLEACRMMKPNILLFASTAAVYAISDDMVCEEDLAEPADIYGMSKLIGEDLCKLFYRDTGVTTLIGRISNVYGTGETNPHVIPEIVNQLKEGGLEIELGNLEPKRDFINVKDVAEAFIALSRDFGGNLGTFNIGTGEEYSIREIIEICERIMGRKIKVKSTGSRKRATDRMHLLTDIQKIMRETKWRHGITIEAGLRELLL